MERRSSGAAVGWTMFAAWSMILLGGWWIFAGLVGLIDDGFYVTPRQYFLRLDSSSWGWIHLIIGAVILLAGFGLFSGNVLARTVGVLVALVAALVGFLWLPWYPFWAILFIIVSFTIIWALTAHGRDIAEFK